MKCFFDDSDFVIIFWQIVNMTWSGPKTAAVKDSRIHVV